jgi:hypothetical protein
MTLQVKGIFSKFARFCGLWVFPALPYTIWLNKIKVQKAPDNEEFNALLAQWVTDLRDPVEEQADAVSSIYQESNDRYANLEAKATGVLTAVAIIAAPATLACTGSTIAAIFGGVALFYLTSGGIACSWILLPSMRYALTIEDVLEPNLLARSATIAKASESGTLRNSNLITSALHDLLRALAITLIAVVLFIAVK